MSGSGKTDTRKEYRESLFQGEFPGYLVPKENENINIRIRPVDVSPRGLGFLANEELRTGAFFWLMIGNHKIRIELAYCSPHLGIENLYRCGLFIREADVDLTVICRNMGLIKKPTP